MRVDAMQNVRLSQMREDILRKEKYLPVRVDAVREEADSQMQKRSLKKHSEGNKKKIEQESLRK